MSKNPRKNAKPEERPTDHGLAPENVAGLNARFYAMDPAAYLMQRVANLVLNHGRGDDVREMLKTKISTERLSFEVPTGAPEDEKESADQRKRFVIAESEVLLHHVSETLLRLYLAHSGRRPCPWLALAGERSFPRFKKSVRRLRERIHAGSATSQIHNIFHAVDDREALTPTPPQDEWDAGAQNIGRFLAFYGSHFLDSSPYNAAKHGLALLAGQSSVEVRIDGEDVPFLTRQGPSIDYLVTKDTEHGPRWNIETKWIDVERSIGLSVIGSRLINSLWTAARSRYKIEPLTELTLFDTPRFEDVMKGEMGNGVKKMAVGFAYREPG